MTDFFSDDFKIDFAALFKHLARRVWIILLAGLLTGAAFFFLLKESTTPVYRANARIYITNTQAASSTTITVGDITLGKELLSTYEVILNTRLTIEEIIEEMELPYSYYTVRNMISASSVDNTDIMEITVTHQNPEFACDLANKVVEVLPKKITYVINGSSTKTVDYAVVPTKPIDDGVLGRAVAAGIVVAVIVLLFFTVPFILNDKVPNEDYLAKTYADEDFRVLSVIPDNSLHGKVKRYGSYGGYGERYGYYSSSAAKK